jgi:hypothetical protein
MTISSAQAEAFAIRPLTPDQIEFLATISAVSFVLGVLALVFVVGAAVAVTLKTKIPGRRSVLFSLVLLSAWLGFEQLMGGSLEMVFGPVALLVTSTVYSASAVVFAVGYLRMCFTFLGRS